MKAQWIDNLMCDPLGIYPQFPKPNIHKYNNANRIKKENFGMAFANIVIDEHFKTNRTTYSHFDQHPNVLLSTLLVSGKLVAGGSNFFNAAL
jgi:hypothetical protein